MSGKQTHDVAPRNVRIALGIMSVLLVLGSFHSVFQIPAVLAEVARDARGRSIPLDPVVIAALWPAASIAFFGTLYFLLYLGHNWARILFLVLCAVSVPLSLWGTIRDVFSTGATLELLSVGARLFALYVFFLTDDKLWFSLDRSG